MSFFRSSLYKYILGLLLAAGVFTSFATPIGGNFRDVAILSMAGVSDVTPVKATFNTDGTATDFTGITRRVEIPQGVSLTPGVVSVADFSYRPADSTYILQNVVSVDPLLTFPLVQGLGELGRNILFHVPMSFVAFVLFLLGTVYSIILLRKKDMKYDLEARAFSAVGLLLTVLATITGSIWARFSWGRFWNFDPRESSILILLLIYIAYFLLRSLMEDSEEKKARIAAVYNIIAFVTVPFLMFVLPRITESLHPGGAGSVAPVINLSGKTYTAPSLLWMLWGMVFLFMLICFWIKDLYVRIVNLENKKGA
jgi:heme exporter protein C